MCIMSYISQDFSDQWKNYKYITTPYDNPNWADILKQLKGSEPAVLYTTAEEFEKFKESVKAELEELKTLLHQAKFYDAINNEPDCEVEEKVVYIKDVAESVNMDVSDVFDTPYTGDDKHNYNPWKVIQFDNYDNLPYTGKIVGSFDDKTLASKFKKYVDDYLAFNYKSPPLVNVYHIKYDAKYVIVNSESNMVIAYTDNIDIALSITKTSFNWRIVKL